MTRSEGRRVAARPTRRTPLRAVSPLALIGGGAVLATVLTLLGVADPAPVADETATPPVSTALERAVVICPPAATPVTVARPLGDRPAPVEVSSARGTETVEVDGHASVPARGVVQVSTTGPAALALLAARVGGSPAPSAAECVPAAGEWWFAGVGAGGAHTSTITLVNPDEEAAVADLEIWSTEGPVTSDELRGVAVESGGSRTIELESLVPLREDAVVRVVVRQGRLAASVLDTVQGADQRLSEHLGATAPPDVRQLVPAVPDKLTDAVVVIGNPGEDTGRAEVRVAGPDSTSAPLGMEAIPVPAGETVTVSLTAATLDLLSSGGTSLVVEGSVPVVASLRGLVNGDPVTLASAPTAVDDSGTVLPVGMRRQLVLSATDVAGAVAVHFVGTDEQWEGRLRPGTSTAVAVPVGAVAARVDTDVSHVGAVRAWGRRGSAWLPVRQLVVDRSQPAVRPDPRPDRD